jgi:hypothetical protein
MIAYEDGDYIGLYPTPNSSNDIRIYYVKAPTALSASTSAIAISDDFKYAIIYGAALKACKRLFAKNPKKFAPIEAGLKRDYEEQMMKVKAQGNRKFGRVSVKMPYKDF